MWQLIASWGVSLLVQTLVQRGYVNNNAATWDSEMDLVTSRENGNSEAIPQIITKFS